MRFSCGNDKKAFRITAFVIPACPVHFRYLSLRADYGMKSALTQKLQLTKYPGRHSGRKSLTAAPLWAVRYQGRPDIFIQKKHVAQKTQILHCQGFYVSMPA
jgi:hypothetical protein